MKFCHFSIYLLITGNGSFVNTEGHTYKVFIFARSDIEGAISPVNPFEDKFLITACYVTSLRHMRIENENINKFMKTNLQGYNAWGIVRMIGLIATV